MLKEIMSRVQSMPAVKVVGGLAGLNIISFSNKSNVGTMFVNLKPWADREDAGLQIKSVLANVQKRIAV